MAHGLHDLLQGCFDDAVLGGLAVLVDDCDLHDTISPFLIQSSFCCPHAGGPSARPCPSGKGTFPLPGTQPLLYTKVAWFVGSVKAFCPTILLHFSLSGKFFHANVLILADVLPAPGRRSAACTKAPQAFCALCLSAQLLFLLTGYDGHQQRRGQQLLRRGAQPHKGRRYDDGLMV